MCLGRQLQGKIFNERIFKRGNQDADVDLHKHGEMHRRRAKAGKGQI